MLRDAIEKLEELALDAAKLSLIELDSRRQIIVQNGRYEIVDVEPPLRDHRVRHLHDLVQAAQNWIPEEKRSIWVDSEAVVLLIDDADRRDRVTMALQYSKQFSALQQLDSPTPFGQKALINFLRVTLDGAVPETLVATFRQVDFARNNSGQSTVEHGRESLGRSIESHVQGRDNLPEHFTADVAVFTNTYLETRESIRVAVIIEPEEQKPFSLQLFPDQAEDAIRRQLANIREAIGNELDESTAVFVGQP